MKSDSKPASGKHAAVQPLLKCLQERIGPKKFNAWFKHGTRICVEDGHVKVCVPNPFVANWIEGHYQGDICAAAAEQTGHARPVVVTIDSSLSQELHKRDLDSQAEIVTNATQGRARTARKPAAAPLRYRLEDFVVGTSNKLAYSAAQAVCGAKKPPFNPLFVYGPCGVGKTHLLHAVCHAVRNKNEVGVE